MKTSLIFRLVTAAFLATLAAIGIAAAVPGSVGLVFISLLILMPRGELTQPIPRREWWGTFPLLGVLLAFLLASPFLHWPPAPGKTARFAIAVTMWLLWLGVIFRRWQRLKGQADA